MMMAARHAPGSQPPFSLNPDPDKNKDDAYSILVVAYSSYIPLSRPNQFCPLLDQNFEKNAQDLLRIPDPVSQRVFAYFHGVQKHFMGEITYHVKHFSIDNQMQCS